MHGAVPYLKETLSEIKDVGKDEFRHASLLQKTWLGATACTLAFEWGTGNEALIAVIAGKVYKHTNDIVLTAAAAGGTSFAEQAVFGLTAAVSIYNFPRFMQTIREKVAGEGIQTGEQNCSPREASLIEEDEVKVKSEVPVEEKRRNKLGALAGRFGTAFSIGTSLKAMKDNGVEEHSFTDNAKNVVTDAGLISGGVVGVAAVGAGIATVGRMVGAEQEADTLVDVISSPYPWAGAFLLVSYIKFRKKLRKREEILPDDNLTPD